ncbi:hypothetical protein ACHAWF_013655, partial [Thalassiosira exigua]
RPGVVRRGADPIRARTQAQPAVRRVRPPPLGPPVQGTGHRELGPQILLRGWKISPPRPDHQRAHEGESAHDVQGHEHGGGVRGVFLPPQHRRGGEVAGIGRAVQDGLSGGRVQQEQGDMDRGREVADKHPAGDADQNIQATGIAEVDQTHQVCHGAKTKKLYMLYDLTPSKEITGGPWYSEYEWDHEFIAELRNFVLMCVRRMNGGNGVTLKQIAAKMIQANVSRVQLNLDEVQQVLQTLAFDYLIEQRGVTEAGEARFAIAKTVSTMCDFGWWDVLSPDFHFCGIRFEDGVYLSAHEPHHHS